MELIDAIRNAGIDTTAIVLADYQRPGDAAIFLMRVPALQVVSVWERLRMATPPVGYWPVIGWDRFKKPWWQEEATNELLAAAEQVNVQSLLSDPDLIRECMHAYRQDFGASEEADEMPPSARYKIPFQRFAYTPEGYTPIAFVPCDVPWKVPAFLRLTEDTNLPQEHAAVLKYWYERSGAELVGWKAGEAELRVPRPPATIEEACVLAVEQYNYCPDPVDQNFGTLARLAHHLISTTVWWFWWD